MDEITNRASPISSYLTETQSIDYIADLQTTANASVIASFLTLIDSIVSPILLELISGNTTPSSATSSNETSFGALSPVKWWTGNLTVLGGKLNVVVVRIYQAIKDHLTEYDDQAWNDEMLFAVLLVCLLVLSPFVFFLIYRMTLTIQIYALGLSEKTKELRREKKRSDMLLYQMLPKSVALQLRLSKKVTKRPL